MTRESLREALQDIAIYIDACNAPTSGVEKILALFDRYEAEKWKTLVDARTSVAIENIQRGYFGYAITALTKLRKDCGLAATVPPPPGAGG